MLVEQAAAQGGAPDLLVYPIVFCYRQYLELELKDLIKIIRRVDGLEHAPLKTHNLVALWKVARDLLDLRDHADTSDLDHAGDILRQFNEVDPGSMTFRYARDIEGARTLPDDLRRINLETLARVVAAVGNLLEGARPCTKRRRTPPTTESSRCLASGAVVVAADEARKTGRRRA